MIETELGRTLFNILILSICIGINVSIFLTWHIWGKPAKSQGQLIINLFLLFFGLPLALLAATGMMVMRYFGGERMIAAWLPRSSA